MAGNGVELQKLRLQSPLMRHRRRVRKSAILICMVLPCAFSPTIYVIVWHVWHGNSVRFADRFVKVPFGWTGSGNDLQANLTKSSPTLIFGTWPLSGIIISKSVRPDIDESAAIQNWHHAQSLSIRPPAAVVETHSSFSCVERSPIEASETVEVACYAFRGFDVEFIGRKRDVPELLNMLRTIPIGRL
jgi:hypothetical protein